MHLIKRTKDPKPQPLIPIISHHFKSPWKKVRGKRYNAKGELVCETGPKRTPDALARQNLLAEQAKAAALPPPPQDTETFDLSHYRPLPGRILLKRPPQITEDNGVALPEKLYRSESWFWVVKVGDRVTACRPGDRVMFAKNHRPKSVRIGEPFHLGYETGIAALVVDEPQPAA